VVHNLFFETKYAGQKEEQLREIAGAILGGTLDGLDARDHIVQLLKDSYTHKELNNKLNFTRGDTDENSILFASRTSYHLRLSVPSTRRSQLDQIKAIQQFNLIGGSSSDGPNCSLSPFTIQTLHLLTTELL